MRATIVCVALLAIMGCAQAARVGAGSQRNLLASYDNCLNNGNCWSANANDIKNHYMGSYFATYVYSSFIGLFLGLDSLKSFNATLYAQIGPLGVKTFDCVYDSTRDTEFCFFATATDAWVVFRGSEPNSIDDWIANDAGSIVNTDSTEYGGGVVSVAKGFHLAFMAVAPQMNSYLTKYAQGKRVWFAGHSLGAAICTLAAGYAKNKGYDVRGVYAYGSPKTGASSWVNRYSALGLQSVTFRWINAAYFGLSRDVVTTVPFCSHVGYPYKTTSCRQEEPSLLPVSAIAHLPENYRSNMWACVPSSLQAYMPPFVLNPFREGK